jgi:putative membrane protein
VTLRNSTAFRIALVGVAAPAALLLGAGPALAATDVTVSNTETIQAHLDASGKVKDKRVYEQLAFTGQGSVDVANPVSADGLRNLDGFGGYDVKDGKLVTKVDVSGEKRLRTVSNFTKDLPLKVEITYTLDGRQVKPGDVVGKSGILEVHYKVTNVTGRAGSVSYDDGTGTQVTKDEQVVIPMVGSLSTTLPSTFTEVQSDQANMAGDGRGGTKLSFTMTLFPPIGSDTAEFGYKARIRDGVVPAATISALPVNPLQSPSFKGGAESYKGGADTGAQLTDGAIQIDENLLKLRDGAGTLLAGLLQLKDGANQLNAGLSGQAAPGAAKLADGAGQLKAGTGQLSAGLNGQLAPGAKQLADGLKTLRASLTDLPTTIGQDPDFQTLIGTMDLLIQGIGNTTSNDSTTVMGGLKQIADGLDQIDAGLPRLQGGLSNPLCVTTDPENPANPCGIQQVAKLLKDQLSSGAAPSTAPILASLATIQGQLGSVGAREAVQYLRSAAVLDCGKASPLQALAAANPALATITYCSKVQRTTNNIADFPAPTTFLTTVEPELVDAVLSGLVAKVGDRTAPAPGTAMRALIGIDQGIGSKTTVDTLLYGLDQIDKGLGSPTVAAPTLRYGVAALRDSLYSKCSPKDQDFPDNCGFSQVLQLVQGGMFSLVDGIAAGITGDADFKRLVAGGGDLAAGASDAADGAKKLDSGAGQLADGANQLQSGLQDAADGSGQLAAGLDKAAGGAPQLKDGAQRLSDEGTKVLIGKGKDTAQNFGEKYALIKAGADRAQAEAMAYGAPEGATGQTAYTLEIAGEDGEGGRNWARGLGALAVFAIGGGAAAAVRQRLV